MLEPPVSGLLGLPRHHTSTQPASLCSLLLFSLSAFLTGGICNVQLYDRFYLGPMFLFLIHIAYWQTFAATHSSVQMRDFKVNSIRTMFISANHALEDRGILQPCSFHKGMLWSC